MQKTDVSLSAEDTLTSTVASFTVLATEGKLELVDLINATSSLSTAGRHNDAFSLYRVWLKHSVSPLKYVAYFNYGSMLATDGKHAQAEQMYRASLELNPNLIQAHLNLGSSLEQQGRRDEAIVQWRGVLAMESISNPENQSLRLYTLNNLGRILSSANNFSQAVPLLELSLSLDPTQEVVKAQLENLLHMINEEKNQSNAEFSGGANPIIYVLACCFNEAAILPFFLDHYTNYVGATKIFLYDGGSTDGSDLIVKDYPVEFIVEKHDKLDDTVLMHIRNEEWKKHRNDCDWFIVCDVDEFLYHPDMKNKLMEYKRAGITLPMVEGSEMFSKVFPCFAKGRYLHQFITAGSPNPGFYNKNLIFDPKIDINYTMGCHRCLPTGDVRRSARAEFKNLHYKLLSFDYLTMKARKSDERLSDWNLKHGAGIHYKGLANQKNEEFIQMFKAADNVLNPVPMPTVCRDGFVPALENLLNRNHDSVIVEIETQRSYDSNCDGGGSTYLFAWYVNRYGGSFYSIDSSRINADNCVRELKQRKLLMENTHIVNDDFSNFIQGFHGAIDLIFLNSRNYRGSETDLKESLEKMLQQFKSCESQLADDALVLIDGVIDDVTWEGCGKLLIPYLMGKNYKLLHGTYQFLFKR
jgi:glycosyltransferase involved in cell wall biosynthesis